MSIKVHCKTEFCYNKGVYDGYCWIHRLPYSIKNFNVCEVLTCDNIPEFGYFAGINNYCKKHWLTYESSTTEFKRFDFDPNFCSMDLCDKTIKRRCFVLFPIFCEHHENVVKGTKKIKQSYIKKSKTY